MAKENEKNVDPKMEELTNKNESKENVSEKDFFSLIKDIDPENIVWTPSLVEAFEKELIKIKEIKKIIDELGEKEEEESKHNPNEKTENDIEITNENFDLRFMGAPVGFSLAKSIKSKENTGRDFYQSIYTGNENKLYIYRNASDNMIYIYKKANLISASNRTGSFFAMSIELPKGIYCSNTNELERLFNTVFEKIVVEKYELLHKIGDEKYGYNEIIKYDEFQHPLVEKAQKEVRNIILNNLRGAFSVDFKEMDDEFRKSIEPNKFYSKKLEEEKEEEEETKSYTYTKEDVSKTITELDEYIKKYVNNGDSPQHNAWFELINNFGLKNKKGYIGEVVANEYHRSKADGSNPELVKAVEELLRKRQNPPPKLSHSRKKTMI